MWNLLLQSSRRCMVSSTHITALSSSSSSSLSSMTRRYSVSTATTTANRLAGGQPSSAAASTASSSTTTVTSSSELLVRQFLQEVRQVFEHANATALPTHSVYPSLSPTVRRDFVKPHKTFAKAMQAALSMMMMVMRNEHPLQKPNSAEGLFQLSEDGLTLYWGGSGGGVGSHKRGNVSGVGVAVGAGGTPRNDEQVVWKSVLESLPLLRDPEPSSASPEPITTTSTRAPSRSTATRRSVIYHALYFPSPKAALLPNMTSSSSSAKISCQFIPHDFFFGVALNRPPPPLPAPIEAAYATRRGETPSDLDGGSGGSGGSDASALSINDFVPYIPTFFVPVTLVVSHLPEGYTEGHIDQYLAIAKTVQIVSVAGERFIRIHGGYGQLDLELSYKAEKEWYGAYRPRPELAATFIRCFEGIRGKWMALRMLLERAGPDACAKLPYPDGPQAILYFAQLQQFFDFSPDNGGAVLLRPDKYSGLTPETSPTIRATSTVLNMVPKEGFMLLSELEELLQRGDTQRAFEPNLEPPPSMVRPSTPTGEEGTTTAIHGGGLEAPPLHNELLEVRQRSWVDIQSHFPSLEYFLRSHGALFWVGQHSEKNQLEKQQREQEEEEEDEEDMDDTGESRTDRAKVNKGPQKAIASSTAATATTTSTSLFVCRKRFIERLERQALPLREQLQLAIAERRKKDARRIRKKLALQNQADSPFFEPLNLAKEIHKALPRRGHAYLKYFLRNQLPEELMNFMPKNYQKFFRQFPELFQCFELHRAGNWCIARAGNPLPQGVLRQQFSDEDCLRIIAQYLARKGPKSISAIYLNLPEGVRDAIKKRHDSIYSFARKHPTYFSVVLPIQHGNAKSAAVLSLLQTPNADGVVGLDQGDADFTEEGENGELGEEDVEHGEPPDSMR